MSRITTWRDSYTVASFDTDPTARASMTGICRYFQESAWRHAEHLGFGYHDLDRHGTLWVLSRFSVRVDRWPRWADSVTVDTWPRKPERLYAPRDYLLRNAAGERLAGASSLWLVIDREQRRPQRVERVLGEGDLPEDRALDIDPPKLPPVDGGAATAYTVRFSDLDLNGHVNNVRYIEWLIDTVPAQTLRGREIEAIDMNYLAETSMGDELELRIAAEGNDAFLHGAVRPSDGKEVFRGRTVWRAV